jgi:hypothetical protein
MGRSILGIKMRWGEVRRTNTKQVKDATRRYENERMFKRAISKKHKGNIIYYLDLQQNLED